MGDDLARRFGLAVRQVRTSRGLSQETLADLAGLDRAYVSGLERGTRNPTLETMQRTAAALQTPLHLLIQAAEEWN